MSTLSGPERLPPAHLKPATALWWAATEAAYTLEDHHLKLLTLAAEAWDRAGGARAAIEKHGCVFADRWRQPKARPEVKIENDSRIAFARLLRDLDLDAEPPRDPRRPPGIGR